MALTTIFAEKELPFVSTGIEGLYLWQSIPSSASLTDGEEYTVVWDGTQYKCTAIAANFNGIDGLGIGNFALAGLGEDTKEPFLFGSAIDGSFSACYTVESDANNKLAIYIETEDEETDDTSYLIRGRTLTAIADAIRAKTGKPNAIPVPNMPSEIYGITAGGGSSEDVRYVTFLSEDGTVEYGKKAVAVGDDCADPIARGVFDTPAKESTAQYHYTFAGWATAANGALNSNALKAVTEDKTVYANFAAVVRYYTINFYDGDTLLERQTVAYGETPAISNPTKEGYSFFAWNPALVSVTGNADYYAQWSEVITFADGAWKDIVRIAEAGEAQMYFALGDTKEFSFTDPDGVSRTGTVKIVGFNKDTLADGSGTAAITIVTTATLFTIAMDSNISYPGWATCSARTALHDTVIPSFPEELQKGLKTVTKTSRKYVDGTDTTGLVSSDDKIWIPSLGEGGYTYIVSSSGIAGEASPGYSGMPNVLSDDTYADGGSQLFWTRSATYNSKGQVAYRMNNTSRTYGRDNANKKYGCLFGFCI